VSSCKNFVAISSAVAEIFFCFAKWRPSASWIHLTHNGTTSEEYFIVVHNFVATGTLSVTYGVQILESEVFFQVLKLLQFS